MLFGGKKSFHTFNTVFTRYKQPSSNWKKADLFRQTWNSSKHNSQVSSLMSWATKVMGSNDWDVLPDEVPAEWPFFNLWIPDWKKFVS